MQPANRAAPQQVWVVHSGVVGVPVNAASAPQYCQSTERHCPTAQAHRLSFTFAHVVKGQAEILAAIANSYHNAIRVWYDGNYPPRRRFCAAVISTALIPYTPAQTVLVKSDS